MTKTQRATASHSPTRFAHEISHGLYRSLEQDGIEWDATGWLTRSVAYPPKSVGEILAAHADWPGPAKLVRSGRGCCRITEVYLAPGTFGDVVVNRRASEELGGLLGELRDGPFGGEPQASEEPWEPPPESDLLRWLQDVGYVAGDEDHNLRLSLISRGCDGQVRIARDAGRLRLSLQLGEWQQLETLSEQAMLRLACQANDSCRLARIVWLRDESRHRCESQVDLTGLPTGDMRDAFWRDMLHAAVRALELSVRRLGLELGGLADKANQTLAKRLLAVDGGRPRQPR